MVAKHKAGAGGVSASALYDVCSQAAKNLAYLKADATDLPGTMERGLEVRRRARAPHPCRSQSRRAPKYVQPRPRQSQHPPLRLARTGWRHVEPQPAG